MKLIVSGSATADLGRLRAILAESNPSAARRAVAVLIDAIDSLQNFPDRGRPSGVEDVRELIVPFGRSAYVVGYRHDEGRAEIQVLRIWHGREARN